MQEMLSPSGIIQFALERRLINGEINHSRLNRARVIICVAQISKNPGGDRTMMGQTEQARKTKESLRKCEE